MRAIKENVVAIFLAAAGIYVFLLSLKDVKPTDIPYPEYLLALLFIGSMILADHYPIHLLRGTKLSFTNLSIFLSTALLSGPLAILAAAIGLSIANVLARTERGLLARDILSTVGQWMLTVYLGYQLIHLDVSGIHVPISSLDLLLLCAFVFLFMDFSVFSLCQSLIYGEPFVATLKSVVKHGLLLEAIQYFIAILGTLAADRDLWALGLLLVPVWITYVAFKSMTETRYETIRILDDMADTVDLRDSFTGGHSKHVADLVRQILVQLKISGPEAALIEISARLHDIGKIGIPDRILLKPGKLSPEEMAVMQTHSEKGAELISKYKDFSRGALIILHHHERWDGQGYPARLKQHEIPFGARIIAVADSFEAMTSDRPYRNALSVDQAVRILLEGRGKQWDPTIVNTLVDMVLNQPHEAAAEEPYKQQTEPTIPQTVLSSSQSSWR
jgi:HD-GYP domain-containing protein (c-di-GMP phosphodiesterase class II)